LASDFHSPFDLAYAPNGETLAVSDHAAKQIVLFKGDGTLHKTVALAGQPAGVAWSCDGSRVYVAERGAWTVTEASGGVAGGQPTGHTTAGGGAT
jgi:DNA-binding beta-propeller fold protein YncE